MRVTLLAVGKAKDTATSLLFERYRKRLPWTLTVREIEAKKGLTGVKRKEEEGMLLLQSLPSGTVVVALDERGKSLGSKAFSETLAAWQNQGRSHVTFIIGGADGLAGEVLQRADLTLSLGAMTWPHMLVRGMLAEQLYRAWTQLSGHPYHRE